MPRDELGKFGTPPNPQVPVREEALKPTPELVATDAAEKPKNNIVGAFDTARAAKAAQLKQEPAEQKLSGVKPLDHISKILQKRALKNTPEAENKAPAQKPIEVKGVPNPTDIADVLKEVQRQAEQKRTEAGELFVKKVLYPAPGIEGAEKEVKPAGGIGTATAAREVAAIKGGLGLTPERINIDDEIKNYPNLSKQQGESLHKIGVTAVEEKLSRAPDAANTPEGAATAPTEEVKGTERTGRTVGETSAPKIELTKEDRESHFDYVGRNAESSAEATPNHNIIGRFGARLERMGIKLINAPQKIVLDTMYDWRRERTARAEGKFEEHKRELAAAETELGSLDKSIELARTTGHYDSTVSVKMDKERALLVEKIGKAKIRLDKAHVAFEKYNGQKAGWENEQKILAEKIAGEIDKRLQPSRDAFAELVRQKGEVVKEIEAHIQTREMHENYLNELRSRIAANPAAAVKPEIQTKIKSVVEMLNRVNNDCNQFNKERIGIETRMNNINTYLGEGQVALNEQLGITSKDNRYAEPGRQPQEGHGAYHNPIFSHAPDIGEQEVAAVPHANTEADAQPKADNDNVPGSAQKTQKQSDIPEPPTPGGASAAAATEQNPQENEEESTLQPDFRQQNKIIKAIESGNFDVLNQTLAGISAEERESFFNKLTSGELKDEQLDELIKKIGFPFSTKEGLQKMQEQIANDNELKNSFNEIIRNYLYPKGVYREGYTASRDEIAKFLQDMPTPRAFDATFIDGRVENIKRAIETETQPGRKETLKAELEFRLTQQKRIYPKVKAFLYGKRAEYWNQIQLLKKQAA